MAGCAAACAARARACRLSQRGAAPGPAAAHCSAGRGLTAGQCASPPVTHSPVSLGCPLPLSPLPPAASPLDSAPIMSSSAALNARSRAASPAYAPPQATGRARVRGGGREAGPGGCRRLRRAAVDPQLLPAARGALLPQAPAKASPPGFITTQLAWPPRPAQPETQPHAPAPAPMHAVKLWKGTTRLTSFLWSKKLASWRSPGCCVRRYWPTLKCCVGWPSLGARGARRGGG